MMQGCSGWLPGCCYAAAIAIAVAIVAMWLSVLDSCHGVARVL